MVRVGCEGKIPKIGGPGGDGGGRTGTGTDTGQPREEGRAERR